MTRTIKVIFCDNEHGSGDMTFPDLFMLEDLREEFIEPRSIAALRKAAKLAGWSRHAGVDYCPGCTEINKDEPEEADTPQLF